MTEAPHEFAAIVLAGDREPDNPVARAADVPCKVLAPVAGIPMISRVISTLEQSASISRIVVCGPDMATFKHSSLLRELAGSGRIDWLEAAETPSMSAWNAMQQIPEHMPILLTTGDHALLSPEIVDFFCAASMKAASDVTAALALLDTVVRAFPGTRRTAYKLKDGAYCSCNLFSFLTPLSRNAAVFWRGVEEKRKNPLKVINTFGWIPAIKYLAGQLTLADGMEYISKCLECRAGVVVMPFPEAAVDVDTPEDLKTVSEIVSRESAPIIM
jgi:GTP:adenosylcobinamide-phosphate guanylyltransferase